MIFHVWMFNAFIATCAKDTRLCDYLGGLEMSRPYSTYIFDLRTVRVLSRACLIEHVLNIGTCPSSIPQISGPPRRVSTCRLVPGTAVFLRAALESFNKPSTRSKSKNLIVLPDGDAAEDVKTHKGDRDTAFS